MSFWLTYKFTSRRVAAQCCLLKGRWMHKTDVLVGTSIPPPSRRVAACRGHWKSVHFSEQGFILLYILLSLTYGNGLKLWITSISSVFTASYKFGDSKMTPNFTFSVPSACRDPTRGWALKLIKKKTPGDLIGIIKAAGRKIFCCKAIWTIPFYKLRIKFCKFRPDVCIVCLPIFFRVNALLLKLIIIPIDPWI